MEVGDKYIIEIETTYGAYASTDRTDMSKVPSELYRIKGFNSLVFDRNGIDKLEKYEPELTQVDLEKARQEGRDEAWEIAKKITLSSAWGGFPTEEFQSIFGNEAYINKVFAEISVNEAIEKIKSYEEQQKVGDEEINVGDEVMIDDDIGVIARKAYADDYYCILWDDGSSGYWKKSKFVKTGRHFPQLQEILDQIREG